MVVVSTHLKTGSQIENLPQLGAEHKKTLWNHRVYKRMENIKVTKIQKPPKKLTPTTRMCLPLARIYGEMLANIPVPWSIWVFHQSWTSTKTRNTKAVSQVDPDSSLLGSAGGKLKKNMGFTTSNGWFFLWTNSRVMVTRPMNPYGYWELLTTLGPQNHETWRF